MRFTNKTAIQVRHDFADDCLDMKLTKRKPRQRSERDLCQEGNHRKD